MSRIEPIIYINWEGKLIWSKKSKYYGKPDLFYEIHGIATHHQIKGPFFFSVENNIPRQ